MTYQSLHLNNTIYTMIQVSPKNDVSTSAITDLKFGISTYISLLYNVHACRSRGFVLEFDCSKSRYIHYLIDDTFNFFNLIFEPRNVSYNIAHLSFVNPLNVFKCTRVQNQSYYKNNIYYNTIWLSKTVEDGLLKKITSKS